jgi:hypothetical protein
MSKHLGQTKDIALKWVLELDEGLEEWRALAEGWLKTQVRGKKHALMGLSKFFQGYLIQQNITSSPKDFLLIGVSPTFPTKTPLRNKSLENRRLYPR